MLRGPDAGETPLPRQLLRWGRLGGAGGALPSRARGGAPRADRSASGAAPRGRPLPAGRLRRRPERGGGLPLVPLAPPRLVVRPPPERLPSRRVARGLRADPEPQALLGSVRAELLRLRRQGAPRAL